MYKNVVATVLGLNGVLLILIGIRIVTSAEAQFDLLGLDASQIDSLTPTVYVLGLSDAVSSIFSLTAMVLIFRDSAAGKTLAYLVGANLLLVGIGLSVLTGAMFGIYFIAPRGAIIVILAWRLRIGDA